MKPLSMPFQVGWDVAHLCNFRCKHCYFTADQLSDKAWLSRDEALAFVQHLSEKKVFHLSLAGGEPLLYPYIVDVVEAASKGGMMVAMSTNASLLTEHLASNLWDAGLRTLQISLDGASADTNDQIRGPRTYEKTTAGLDIALRMGFSVFLAIVLLRSNRREIFDYIDFATEKGVKGIKVQTLIDAGLGHQNHQELALQEDELRDLLKELWKYKPTLHGKLELMLPLIPEAVAQAKTEPEYYNRNTSCLGCQPGLSTIRVSSKGDVRACGGFVNDESVGNVVQRPLQDIWLESQEIARWRNASQVLEGKTTTSCGSICGKGCRAASAPQFAKS